ncbi:uncharacterized protein [Mytilus edulis]|uniref:uncharacterized protein n=1 Tax=Mytilus edulis TaxID=6550 RepID=UPI0039F0FA09
MMIIFVTAHKGFGLFDITDNCVIKTWELKSVLSSLGQNIITDEKLRAMIQEADVHGNGIIDFDKFIKKMISTNVIIASELSREELAAYKEAFGLFDANGDGVISTWELKSVLRALGQNPSNEELIEMIREADLDGNGIIDFDEFINMMIRRNNSEESDETLREAFNIFDHDNNNFITCADLRYVIKSLGLDISDETIDEMVREADEDGNGKVGVEEFIKIMRSK